MDRSSVKEFLRAVGGAGIKMYDHPKWVSVHCLLAPWTHERGQDRTPSAGVSVHDDDVSVWNCYACGKRSLGGLLGALERYTGRDYSELKEELGDQEFFGGELPEWGAKQSYALELSPLNPAEFLEIYEPAYTHPYVVSRGINRGTARQLDLRVDPEDSEGVERILFPAYTPDGLLLGFTGRDVTGEARIKARDYFGLPKEALLLGIHNRPTDASRVVLVEGPFDYAKVTQAGEFCVAALHSSITQYQAMLLRDIGLPIVCMYDNDAAGWKGTKDVINALGQYLPVSKVTYFSGTRYANDWIKMDPGQCNEDEIIDLITRAEPA